VSLFSAQEESTPVKPIADSAYESHLEPWSPVSVQPSASVLSAPKHTLEIGTNTEPKQMVDMATSTGDIYIAHKGVLCKAVVADKEIQSSISVDTHTVASQIELPKSTNVQCQTEHKEYSDMSVGSDCGESDNIVIEDEDMLFNAEKSCESDHHVMNDKDRDLCNIESYQAFFDVYGRKYTTKYEYSKYIHDPERNKAILHILGHMDGKCKLYDCIFDDVIVRVNSGVTDFCGLWYFKCCEQYWEPAKLQLKPDKKVKYISKSYPVYHDIQDIVTVKLSRVIAKLQSIHKPDQ
jgi:hypothetical protein